MQIGQVARAAGKELLGWLAAVAVLGVVGLLLGVCVLKGPESRPHPEVPAFKLYEDGGSGPGAPAPLTPGPPGARGLGGGDSPTLTPIS